MVIALRTSSVSSRPSYIRRMAVGLASAAALVAAQLVAPTEGHAVVTTPPPPGNLRVTARGFDTVSLAWDRSPGAEFYRVLVDGVWRSGVYDPTTTGTVTQLKVGTSYTFEVQGQGADGTVGSGASVRAATQADDQPPTKPAKLRVDRDGTGRSLGLTWDPSTDNWGVLPGYRIFANGQQVLVSGPPTAWTWLTDPYHGGLSCGQAYSFTVRAVDKNNNASPPSDPLTATPPC